MRIGESKLSWALVLALILFAGCGGAPSTTGTGGTTPVAAVSAVPGFDSFVEVPYNKLKSKAYLEEMAQTKYVRFTAVFVEESRMPGMYQAAGLDTQGNVFIKHFGEMPADSFSADGQGEPFGLCIAKTKSDIVFDLKRGDQFTVWGEVIPVSQSGLTTPMYVIAHKIEKVAATPTP